MERRVVFEKSPRSHEDNSRELHQSNEPEKHFLQTNFDVCVEQLTLNPNYDGIVDEIKEKEIEKNGATYLCSILFRISKDLIIYYISYSS